MPSPRSTDETSELSRPRAPTSPTTQQLIHEITALRDVLEAKFDELANTNVLRHKIIETRLEGMDKAIGLLQTATDKVPAAVDEKITALRGIHEEKFLSVQTQFRERDVRTEQSSKDSKVAVDAALQAAKEAVGEQNRSAALAIAKSETATVKQIDQMGVLIQTGSKAVDDKFDDIKERLTRIEGKDEGATQTGHQQQQSSSYTLAVVVGVAGIVFGVVGVGVALVGFFRH